ncbi:hypothetical protein DUNSADRAFT_6610 [Dunaliella salina]|uniref:Cytosolic carboxypeptidase N-terminal domain-containing protein n=1 Tax=Dunaliella salina TaxID=3046 RepID=A0ABQ7FUC2_DUNSA|nr:hypothetical protein DUNSADRAFT_6610 [Dunaliella salina]|eukprot:KAF5825833.1 hypothetical protein DUNSADRAFT_6610 [Dunaliella salina]
MDHQFYPRKKIPCSEPDKQDAVWKVGKYVFRADFDSANLLYVRQGNSNCEVQLWTRQDCQGTEHERGTRSWFHFGVSGHGPGDWVALNIMNINKQGKLFGQDYRPWFWRASMAEWQPVNSKVIYKREDEDFQLRFSFKFESAEEVFFAFAIPFSYRENQVRGGVTGALQKG